MTSESQRAWLVYTENFTPPEKLPTEAAILIKAIVSDEEVYTQEGGNDADLS